ncbi:uncharacterized protein VTP21DRAFT_7442 [Calcarisporiella thermophila]|uniref:uncharacterized protein n=1 Tax=Calcarisporiella thermophila TaxID=911321 RepID=UPI003742CADC
MKATETLKLFSMTNVIRKMNWREISREASGARLGNIGFAYCLSGWSFNRQGITSSGHCVRSECHRLMTWCRGLVLEDKIFRAGVVDDSINIANFKEYSVEWSQEGTNVRFSEKMP